MKLKTLKDIEKIDNVGAVLPADLCKNAIKWIKEMGRVSDERGWFCLNHGQDDKLCEKDKQIDCFKECNTVCDYPYESTDITAIIDFIEAFFNITEEELK